jgi:hypothetical protein
MTVSRLAARTSGRCSGAARSIRPVARQALRDESRSGCVAIEVHADDGGAAADHNVQTFVRNLDGALCRGV